MQVVIKSIRAGRRLASRKLLGPSTKIDFEVIVPEGQSQQDMNNALTALAFDSTDLMNHIVSAVASDGGMKAMLAAEGMTLVDLAAVKLTVETSSASVPVDAEVSQGVSAVAYVGGGIGAAALVGGLVTGDLLRIPVLTDHQRILAPLKFAR